MEKAGKARDERNFNKLTTDVAVCVNMSRQQEFQQLKIAAVSKTRLNNVKGREMMEELARERKWQRQGRRIELQRK